MSPELLSELSNLSAAASVIVIVILFLRHIDAKNDQSEKRAAKAEEAFESDLKRIVDGAQQLNQSLANANERLVDVVDKKLDTVVERSEALLHQSTKVEELLLLQIRDKLDGIDRK